jgi:hypothetical protein
MNIIWTVLEKMEVANNRSSPTNANKGNLPA